MQSTSTWTPTGMLATYASGSTSVSYTYLCSGQPQFTRNFRGEAGRVATLHPRRLARAA